MRDKTSLAAALIAVALHGAALTWWAVGEPHTPPRAPAEKVISVALLAGAASVAAPAQPVSRPPPAPAESPPSPEVVQAPREVTPPVTPRRERKRRGAQQPAAGESKPETPASTHQAHMPAAAAPSHATAAEAATAPIFDAAYLRNAAPAYPRLARRTGQQGTVELKVRVSTEGSVMALEVVRTSGSPVLDKAALEAVREWRFAPARRGETPIDAWVIVPIQFKLEA